MLALQTASEATEIIFRTLGEGTVSGAKGGEAKRAAGRVGKFRDKMTKFATDVPTTLYLYCCDSKNENHC